MTLLKILIYKGKHGDQHWLADTPTRAVQAREALFRQLDGYGFYEDDEDNLEQARAGNAQAIEIILDRRNGYEYEEWRYEHVEVPCNGGIPGLAELLDFDTYQKSAHGTAEYPPEIGIFYATLGLAGEGGEVAALLLDLLVAGLNVAKHTGEVANQVKKIARDDDGLLTSARKRAVVKELGGMFWYAAEIATLMGISLADVPSANLRQLYSRKERGTIKGDGDDR